MAEICFFSGLFEEEIDTVSLLSPSEFLTALSNVSQPAALLQFRALLEESKSNAEICFLSCFLGDKNDFELQKSVLCSVWPIDNRFA